MNMTMKHMVLFFLLFISMTFMVVYILNSELKQNALLNKIQKQIEVKLSENRKRIQDEIVNDLVIETILDLQYEVEEEVISKYKETLLNNVRKRYLKEMIYILFRDLKWKIVRDLKVNFKDEVRLFVKDNPKYVLVRKEPKAPIKVSAIEAYEKTEKKEFILPPEPDIISADVNNICQGTKIKHHNHVLSFCVYGKRQIYYDGIEVVMRNARNISLYKNWQIRIYHDEAVSPEKIKEFLKMDDNILFCDARKLPRYGNAQNILGKFWRVAPISDPSVDVMCSRDLDSKILTREEDAVNEWLSSGMVLHTMRDHRQHEVGMMAGMWCWNNRINRTIGRFYFDRLMEKAKTYTRRTDQPLLNKVIWDHISKHNLYDMVLQHDSYNCKFYKGSKPFPTKRVRDNEFIGCPVHECDQVLKPCPEMCRPSYGKAWKYC